MLNHRPLLARYRWLQVWPHRPIAFDFDSLRLKLSKQDLQARMIAELNNHYASQSSTAEAEYADAAVEAMLPAVAPPPPGSASVAAVSHTYSSGHIAPADASHLHSREARPPAHPSPPQRSPPPKHGDLASAAASLDFSDILRTDWTREALDAADAAAAAARASGDAAASDGLAPGELEFSGPAPELSLSAKQDVMKERAAAMQRAVLMHQRQSKGLEVLAAAGGRGDGGGIGECLCLLGLTLLCTAVCLGSTPTPLCVDRLCGCVLCGCVLCGRVLCVRDQQRLRVPAARASRSPRTGRPGRCL